MTEKEILQQQEQNEQKVFYLIAVGMFYHAYGGGAFALSRATDYRVLRKHRKGGDILVCGFPANQLENTGGQERCVYRGSGTMCISGVRWRSWKTEAHVPRGDTTLTRR